MNTATNKTPAGNTSRGDSTPVRVAIVGTGRISDLHAIEYLQNSAARLTALCDINPELARSRANRWGCDDVAIENDLDALLAREDVDLVELLLPHHLHLTAALKAIDAGKIVSLQKPMCMTMQEADQLVSAVDGYDRPFKVFENFIFYPPVMKARSLIEQGAIGEPCSIRLKSNRAYSATAWQVPEQAEAWRQAENSGGGGPLIFDDGHHKFALAWHFMGEPQQVHAFVHHTEQADGSVVDAPSIVSFRFANNRVGSLETVYSPEMEIITRYYAQDDRVEITGTRGIIWINQGHGHLAGVPPLSLYTDGKLTHFDDVDAGWEQSFVHSTRHFLNVLQLGGEPVLTARQARRILRFALAAEESARIGRAVTIEQHPDD